MNPEQKQIITRIALKWYLKPAFLNTIYRLMINDPEFYSQKKPYGIRYQAVKSYLQQEYQLTLTVRQLKYLVKQVKE